MAPLTCAAARPPGIPPAMPCCSTSIAGAAPPSFFLCPLRRRPRSKHGSLAISTDVASLCDPFVLDIAEKLEDSIPVSSPPYFKPLRAISSASLLSRSWPTKKDEPFRFTDVSALRNSQVLPAPPPSISPPPPLDLPPHPNLLVIFDGHYVPSLSRITALPSGAFAGPLSDLSPGPVLDRALQVVRSGYSFPERDLFWDLNGLGAPDITLIYIPAGVAVTDEPIYVWFCSSKGGEDVDSGVLPISNPRLVVLVEDAAELVMVEEHFGIGSSEGRRGYWANPVTEFAIGKGAKVSHSYVQKQSPYSTHIKWTSVRQEATSTFNLAEVSLGGKLSRHNLHIQQLGPDTVTKLSAFHLASSHQLHDLHSRLILDHPKGSSYQLHKCIVSHPSGEGVFDGNIKVNRFAQKTDAAQLTRTLLLVPKATVNAKPNLQIVADDVKCSHGATVCDVEPEAMFYLSARGIDPRAARDALAFAFGAAVLDEIPVRPLREALGAQVKERMAAAAAST